MQRSAPLRSKPKAWAKPERRLPVVPAVVAAPRAVMALCVEPAAPMPKVQTLRSESWLAAVRSLPMCVRCRGGSLGIQAAHRNEGKGKGLKTHDCWTAALCPHCHFEIDQGKGLTRDSRRAEIDRCIVLTLAELVLAGKVGVIA